MSASAQSIVNATYIESGDLLATYPDGTTMIFNLGSMAYMVVSAVLVMIMAPAIGFIYAGMLNQRNALTMVLFSLTVYSVGTVAWYFWGYSLAFSATGSKFIGDLANFGFIGVLDQPSGNIPVLLFAFYQSMFSAVTPVILTGAFAERSRLLPVLLFVFCWQTIVYAPVAHWVWSSLGWAFQLGDLDFAGGNAVHSTSGAAALAISFFLGKRRGYGTEATQYRAQNVSHTILGTALLWFGWFGFNGGSALAMNMRAVNASVVTNLAAAMGGITWMLLDSFRTKKQSAISFCSGVLAGLVGITPAAGYVGAPASLAIGFLAAVGGNYGTYISRLLKIDDVLDIFATHGVAATVGSVCTALFAENKWSSLDGVGAGMGWPDHHYIQLGYNLAVSVAVLSYSFVVTLILLYLINFIPGLKFRPSESDEIVGMDLSVVGERIYGWQPLDLEEAGITKAATQHYQYNYEKETSPAPTPAMQAESTSSNGATAV